MRIKISDIKNKKSGLISGRIESVDENFIYLSDESGNLKLLHKNNIQKLKSGDIIQVNFEKNDEICMAVKVELLNSCLNDPLSDSHSPYFKLHTKNKKLINTLYTRQDFFQHTRDFFNKNDFLHIHSPTLVESPGIENYIEPFKTSYFDYKNEENIFYLPTSPEFSLKEALSGGLENIFEIAKVFRNNGEDSVLHNPEFFMLEWYRAYCDYYKIMDDCEEYLKFLGNTVFKKDYIEYDNKKCSLKKIDRIKVKDLFKEFDIDLDDYTLNEKKFIKDSLTLLKKSADSESLNKLNKEDIFFKIFLNKIEPVLGCDNPVIIYEYPREMAALSKICSDNPIYSKRFELYICGIEIANAFDELIDYDEQKKRFKKVLENREKNKMIKLKMPDRFLQSLKWGLPPCSGIALGMERLFMLFEGMSNIKETNLYY